MSEDNEKKPTPSALGDHINLKVLTQDNQVVQFKLKKTTALKKLMNSFCEKTNLDRGLLRFRFDGRKIDETDTPQKLNMDDGDCIEVYQEQIGG